MTNNKWIKYFKDPLNFTLSFGLIKPGEVLDTWDKDMETQLHEGVLDFVKNQSLLVDKTVCSSFKVKDYVTVGSTTEEDGSRWYCVIPIINHVVFQLKAGNPAEKHYLESPETAGTIPIRVDLNTDTAFHPLFKEMRLANSKNDGQDISTLFYHLETPYEQYIPGTLYVPEYDLSGQHFLLISKLQKAFIERRGSIQKKIPLHDRAR